MAPITMDGGITIEGGIHMGIQIPLTTSIAQSYSNGACMGMI